MKKTILLVSLILISFCTNAKLMSNNYDDDEVPFDGLMNGKKIIMVFNTPAFNYNHDQGYFYFVGTKTKIEFEGEDEIDEHGNLRNPDVQKLYEIRNGKKIGYFIFDFGEFFLNVKKEKINGQYYDMTGKSLYRIVLTKKRH